MSRIINQQCKKCKKLRIALCSVCDVCLYCCNHVTDEWKQKRNKKDDSKMSERNCLQCNKKIRHDSDLQFCDVNCAALWVIR